MLFSSLLPHGLIFFTGFFLEPGPRELGDSRSIALRDSVGVSLLVGVWDSRLPPGVEEENLAGLGKVTEETLDVDTTSSV